ncbi:chemokine XC receptor 1-like [Pholidichthys leucotaenia]
MANKSTWNGEDVSDNSPSVYLCEIDSDFSTISGILFILIFFISVIGNVLLLCVLGIYENLKNITNVFILNLAISDLIFTVTLPFWSIYHLHHWIFGDIFCKFVTAASFIGLYSSVILLTVMTVDRFIAVVLYSWPISYKSRKRCAIGACFAAWVISIAASISDAVSVRMETDMEGLNYCQDNSDNHDVRPGYYLQWSLLFFLPFVIILFCYSAILKTVLQASNRRRYRSVAVVLCIVVAFFLCWGPYNTILFIIPLYTLRDCKELNQLNIAKDICHILAFSHCCMNPLLYMLSQRLKGHLLHLLRCNNVRENNRERNNGQSISAAHNVAFIAQTSAVIIGPHNNSVNDYF